MSLSPSDQEKAISRLNKAVDGQRQALAQATTDLEHKFDVLKATIPTDLAAKLAKLEEGVSNQKWVIGFIVTLVLICLGYLYGLNGRMSAIETKVSGIDSTLTEMRGSIQKLGVAQQVTLPQPDFNKALPEVRTAVANLKKESVTLPLPVVDSLKEKLVNADATAPAYWPATAEFISYRSQILVPNVQSLLRLPKCSAKKPIPMPSSIIPPAEPTPETMTAYYDDCTLTLDSPDEAQQIFEAFENKVFIVTFRHCHIVWSGGDIALLAETSKKGQNNGRYFMNGLKLMHFTTSFIRFKECLFEFNLSGPPKPQGQEFARHILEQNGPGFIYPIGEPEPYS